MTYTLSQSSVDRQSLVLAVLEQEGRKKREKEGRRTRGEEKKEGKGNDEEEKEKTAVTAIKACIEGGKRRREFARGIT